MMAVRFTRLVVCGLLILLLLVVSATANCDTDEDDNCLRSNLKTEKITANALEEEIEFWRASAIERLNNKLTNEIVYNENRAKNIIFFLGDGMSLATIAATRMYMGGEEKTLSFESFPHFGLAKTYCVDHQVSDSACTATALLHGVKANYGTLGLNGHASRYDCAAYADQSKHTESIVKWAQDNCKATGYVTTTRVTHATPAAIYAHASDRNFENDVKVAQSCDPKTTVDIARQLIENEVGSKLKVILGGGRREFLNNTMLDDEGVPGNRVDGRNLIATWVAERSKQGNAAYLWNEQLLRTLDFDRTDYLMGLFESDHCKYNIDIEREELTESKPSLTEMTEAALRILQTDANGFFLLVESGRIDTAHHDTMAHKALDETKELNNAIAMVRRMTNDSDTLIVVTADHSQVMSYNGYSPRGNDILGLSGRVGGDGKPYSTLSYANGMGYYNTYIDGSRKDISQLNFADPDLKFMSTVPRDSETHGGDDVGVYASGPWSHMFTGNYEQNNIPLVLAFAAKIGPYAATPSATKCSGGTVVQMSLALIVMAILRLIF